MIEGELPASVEGLRRLAFDLGGVRDRVTAVERAVAGRLLPFDTGPGDLVGFDADGNPVLIDAAAGDGYGLTSDISQTGGVKWSWPAGSLGCKLYRVGAVSTAATAGWIPVTQLNTAAWDHHPGTAQADTSNGRIYARVTGVYLAHAHLGISAWSGLKGLSILRNGALANIDSGHQHWVDDTSENYKTTSSEIYLTAGQYIQLGVYNNAATARVIDTSFCALSMSLLRASS